jgi:predicted metalloprotease
MLTKGRRRSSNIEDRRGMPAAGGMALGGVGGIVVLVLALLFGKDPGEILQQAPPPSSQASGQPYTPTAEERELEEFVGVALADTEDIWNQIFADMGREYQEPTLVLFSGSVESACGYASAAVGPFYCPGDQNLYIDLQFFQELGSRFGAHGDFPAAYVVAHEVAHHVQHELGITDEMDAKRSRMSQTEYNDQSVRLELQADFFAGVWAHFNQATKGVLEPGDIEEAMRAAAAIGDDKLQMEAQGYVVPDSFTHGTSEQRMRWFMKGYKTGDIRQGDTFSARDL